MTTGCTCLVLATGNAHKVQELRRLLAPLNIPLQSLSEFPLLFPASEDGQTVQENAVQKAVWYAAVGQVGPDRRYRPAGRCPGWSARCSFLTLCRSRGDHGAESGAVVGSAERRALAAADRPVRLPPGRSRPGRSDCGAGGGRLRRARCAASRPMELTVLATTCYSSQRTAAG